MFSKVPILNIEIHNVLLHELLHHLERGLVVTPNVDHLMKLQKDYEFYKIYKQADYVICDSQIVYYASRLLGKPILEKVAGSDFFPALCNYHKDNHDYLVFLLGGSEISVRKAAWRLNEKAGRTMVTGYYSPSFGFENDSTECAKIIYLINKSRATLLAVGVGAPKQEKWISKYKDQLPGVKLFLGIGATIEFEAGTVPRAPAWMRKSGLEWFYRLIKEPKRLWKRYLVESMPFLKLLYEQRRNRYKDPFAGLYAKEVCAGFPVKEGDSETWHEKNDASTVVC